MARHGNGRNESMTREVEEHARAAASGDAGSFDWLFQRYADPVWRFIRLRVGPDLALADDVAQETWERVVKAIRSYQTKGAGFPAWLFTIARNTAREHQRGLLRRRETLCGDFVADDYTAAGGYAGDDARLEAHHLAAAVETLLPAQRQCVRLRFYAGLSLEDTAAVMGRTVGSIKQLQRRALGNLAKHYQGDNERSRSPVVSLTDAVLMGATMEESRR